jgi:hypothetical protein
MPPVLRRFRSPAPSSEWQSSASTYESRPQVLVHCLFRHPERATDPYSF